MKPLDFLKRANKEHFPPDANVWDVNLMFSIEKQVIDEKIETEATSNWRKQRSVDDALAQGDALIAQIASEYDPPKVKVDHKIFGQAQGGELERMSPPVKAITTMKIAFIVAVITECSVMVLQNLFSGEFNPFSIVLAIFLAMGGFLQGMGVGHLLVRSWRVHNGRVERENSIATAGLLVGIGTALILAIAAMRALGSSGLEFFLVFIVTLLFGEAVAVCEAIKLKYSSVRADLLRDMAQAQQWQANDSHHKHIEEGIYKATYEAAVMRAARENSQVRQPDAQKTRSAGGEYTTASAPT